MGLDWIIGSPDMTLVTQDDFYNLMIHNTNQPVRLIVYNVDSDSCREAAVTPSFEWGGEGWYTKGAAWADLICVAWGATLVVGCCTGFPLIKMEDYKRAFGLPSRQPPPRRRW